MAAQKYVRIKDRNGLVIDWHRELHIIPERMEVFESETTPPDYIEDLLEWKVAQVNDAAAKVAAVKKPKEAKAE